MATFTNQQSRLLTLATPLGDDVLLLSAFTGQEALSQLFTYQLEMVSEEEDIKAADIVGKNVTWGVQEWDKETRWFNGHVCAFSAGATRLHDRRVYRMEVVPYFWFLTRTANCRIFQHQKTPDILQRIFKDYGLKHYELSLKRSYPEWEYCVQYRETAFNFAARLMEHEGIFWFFKHENGKHILVLADHKGAIKEVPDNPVDFLAGTVSPNHISSWEHRYVFRTGKWAQTDYNFKTPSTNLLTNIETIIKVPGMDKFEIFDYPGEYPAKGDGQADIKIRMEEEEAAHDLVTATSGCPMFSPGFKFSLYSHEIESENGKNYLITSIQHTAVDTSEDQSGEIADYQNSLTCMPADVVFRPQRMTPKPIVQGPQTAVVVGPAGEEIYPDEHGRIKVQFHWDRYGQKDENSSCWMRVSQVHAGKKWGGIDIPRIGEEVIVNFLEGDPDRPIVTGRVYNAEQAPPFDLPKKKMVSGLKSNTYPGGGGYNQMTMDDTKGKELVQIHGQYDMDTRVEHDERISIGNDRTEEVINNESVTIGNDRTAMVVNNETVAVGNNRSATVGVDHTEVVGANHTQSVGANHTQSVGANQAVTVAVNQAQSVGVNQAVSVGVMQTVNVGAVRMKSVGLVDLANAGLVTVVSAGLTVTVSAGVKLVLEAPGGTITIDPAGIEIKGKKILIQGGLVEINP